MFFTSSWWLFSLIKERRKGQITCCDWETLDFHCQNQTRSYSKAWSWNKMTWVLMRWMIYLSVLVAKFKPLPTLKRNRHGRCKMDHDNLPEIVQLEAGEGLGEGWTVCFCAVSISVWKGGITANNFTWNLLWLCSSCKTHVNQDLFVSFLFQAFLEAAKNVFCICSYADFCFHMAGNNSPHLYQPFSRNSSNSFKKYKREKSSGKEQEDVSHCIFRKTFLTLRHQMNL